MYKKKYVNNTFDDRGLPCNDLWRGVIEFMAEDTANLVQKISFTFEKAGLSRFYSHHDLMRHFERALRRASLAVRLSSGFNPRPRMVFPHPLSLGVSSLCEEIEIEFTDSLPAEEIFRKLAVQVKPVVKLLAWKKLPPVKKGRKVVSSEYEITGWPDLPAIAVELGAMLEEEKILVTRGHGRKERLIDMRPYIIDGVITAKGLRLKIKHLENGAGRVDEVNKYLSEKLGLDWCSHEMTRVTMEFCN